SGAAAGPCPPDPAVRILPRRSAGSGASPASPKARRLYWWEEALTVLVLYDVYSALPKLSQGSRAEAYRHARQLMHWQTRMGLNHEATLQSWALHSRPL